jgi:UDP-N-acetylmuramoyl-tripeptide--D-alanyl-D-alanine ligase
LGEIREEWVRRALILEGGGSRRRFTAIATDTRTLVPGALFVALRGERYDAHDFLDAARQAGAAGAVVREGTAPVDGLPLLHVPDPLTAYGLLARARRRDLAGPVVAVTGTNGKTSTKEMLAAVLGTRFRTHATRINLNNLVGVPQTILEAPETTEALVVEAGASVPGEMAIHRTVIEPTIAVVTNVAPGHLEGFGGMEGVLAEKLELVRGVAVAVVGTSPPELGALARQRGPGRVVTAGLEGADFTPTRVEMDREGRAILFLRPHRVALPLVGRHQASNAMLAWAVGHELGLDPEAAARALERVAIPGGRGQLTRIGGMTVYNDCYNANPASFEAAIAAAAGLRAGRRLVFIAGSMRELGPDSPRYHREVARRLVDLSPDLLAVEGDFVPGIEPWREALADRLVTASDVASLGPLLADRLLGNELVVLKASRGVALERILPAITARAARSEEA